MILTVIPIVIPVGAGDALREIINDIKGKLDLLSSFVGFDVSLSLKCILILFAFYTLYRVVSKIII